MFFLMIITDKSRADYNVVYQLVSQYTNTAVTDDNVGLVAIAQL